MNMKHKPEDLNLNAQVALRPLYPWEILTFNVRGPNYSGST